MKPLAKKTLVLPVEIKVRELSSKTLLALLCASRGMRVYLGDKGAISELLSKLRSGVYFYKSGTYTQEILDLKKTLSHFVVLDEEIGPSVIYFDLYMKLRVFHDSLPLIDKFYAFGDRHGEALKEAFGDICIENVGWPRIDLWRPEFRCIYNDKIQEIQSRYGDYVFLPSNFAVNTEKARQQAYRVIDERPISGEERSFLKAAIDRSILAYQSYRDLFLELASLRPQVNFIIRPHPSDDHQEWKKSFEGVQNVHVIFEGDVSAWLYAAKGVIHYGCTTGVQAGMHGIPILSYRRPEGKFGESLPHLISQQASTMNEVLSFIDTLGQISREDVRARVYEIIKHHISSVMGELASSKIATSLSSLDTPLVPPAVFSKTEKVGSVVRGKVGALKKFVKSYLEVSEIVRPSKMLGGISKEEVKSFLTQLAPVVGVAADKIQCREVRKGLMEIELQ